MLPDGYERIDRILAWPPTDQTLDVKAAILDGLKTGQLVAKAYLHKRFIIEYTTDLWIEAAHESEAERIMRVGFVELEQECLDDDTSAPVVLDLALCRKICGPPASNTAHAYKNKTGRPVEIDWEEFWMIVSFITHTEGLTSNQSKFRGQISSFYAVNIGKDGPSDPTMKPKIRKYLNFCKENGMLSRDNN